MEHYSKVLPDILPGKQVKKREREREKDSQNQTKFINN